MKLPKKNGLNKTPELLAAMETASPDANRGYSVQRATIFEQSENLVAPKKLSYFLVDKNFVRHINERQRHDA